MLGIKKFHRRLIEEHGLSLFKIHAVLLLIGFVFWWIPSEMHFIHNYNVIMWRLVCKRACAFLFECRTFERSLFGLRSDWGTGVFKIGSLDWFDFRFMYFFNFQTSEDFLPPASLEELRRWTEKSRIRSSLPSSVVPLVNEVNGWWKFFIYIFYRTFERSLFGLRFD